MSSLIQMIEKEKMSMGSNSSILVHCSAGVGRTGVFMVLYHLFQREKYKDQKIKVLDLIAFLRWQRTYSVATLSQYIFCQSWEEILAEAMTSAL